MGDTSRQSVITERCPLCSRKRTNSRQKRTFALQQKAPLFEHLIGEREQLIRHGKGNRLRSLGVDHKLELSWLLHGQLGGGPTLQNHVDVLGGATVKCRRSTPYEINPPASGNSLLPYTIGRPVVMARSAICRRVLTSNASSSVSRPKRFCTAKT